MPARKRRVAKTPAGREHPSIRVRVNGTKIDLTRHIGLVTRAATLACSGGSAPRRKGAPSALSTSTDVPCAVDANCVFLEEVIVNGQTWLIFFCVDEVVVYPVPPP
jgi:hypothetical protein